MSKASVDLSLPDLAATSRLGSCLGMMAEAGDVLTLSGDLGAGKTTLAQHIGRALGVPPEQPITSPTFSLLHEYAARLPFHHMDLYRLAGEEEFELAGLGDFLADGQRRPSDGRARDGGSPAGGGLTVIEWPDRLGCLMPRDRLEIDLCLLDGTARSATLTAHGQHWQTKLPLLLARFATAW